VTEKHWKVAPGTKVYIDPSFLTAEAAMEAHHLYPALEAYFGVVGEVVFLDMVGDNNYGLVVDYGREVAWIPYLPFGINKAVRVHEGNTT
jgi:hypothetical protein